MSLRLEVGLERKPGPNGARREDRGALATLRCAVLGAGTTRRDSAVRCSDRDAIQAAARPRGRELQDGRPLGRARQRGRGLERARHREQRCKVILPPASFGLELDGAPGGRERRRGTPAPPPQPTVMEAQVGLTGVALERIAKRRLSLDLVARFHQERHQVRAQVRLLRLEVDRAPGRRDSLLPDIALAQAGSGGNTWCRSLDIAGERLAQHELGFTNPACLQEQLRQMTMPDLALSGSSATARHPASTASSRRPRRCSRWLRWKCRSGSPG